MNALFRLSLEHDELTCGFAGARRADDGPAGPTYSVCTLVNDREAYEAAVRSLRDGGFREPDCEFLYLDNTRGNAYEAFAAYNLFLRRAQGRFVILCHQDIRLLSHGRKRLDEIITELDRVDPDWGLLGNAGGLPAGGLAMRITDPRNDDVLVGGPLPRRCTSLDENFIVVRANANLAVSHDLSGFHFYGTDLCIIASVLGYTSYVVDFHLHHLSSGRTGDEFPAARQDMIRKYARALVPRFVATSSSTVVLVPFRFLAFLANSGKGTIMIGAGLRLRDRLAGLLASRRQRLTRLG